MNQRQLFFLCALCLLALPALAAPSAEELSAQMKAVSAQIQDMQATMITTIVSSLMGNKPMIQSAKIIKKGDKTRMEMTIPGMGGQPARIQTTITSGNETWVIGNDGAVRKMGLGQGSGGKGQGNTGMDPAKYMDTFTITVNETSQNYMLIGTPKAGGTAVNAYFGKIVTTVPKAAMTPTLLQIYKPDNSILMTTTMEYREINGCPVATKTITSMTIGISGARAQTMKITVEYKDVAVNQGVEDGVFAVD
jgi:outer membrane lipoprotein-sorting protein